METSDYIALGALLVALGSLCLSGFSFFFDRVRLKATCKIYNHDSPFLEIKIHNCGRRVATLTKFGGTLSDGHWVAHYLGEKNQYIRIEENHFHREELTYSDFQHFDEQKNDVFYYKNLWFEDSLGKRHKVKKSKHIIKQFLKS